MTVGFARPDVSNLVFRVYDRSVHPELLSVYAEQHLVRGPFDVWLRVCEAGHAISLRCAEGVVTEVAACSEQPLPDHKCRFSKRLSGHRDTAIKLECGIQYHSSYQVERLDPEVFLNFHQEVSLDCDKASLGHRFASGNRLAPGPLSLIQADISSECVLIHAFHTFPENCAVVKTQSLFER